MTEIMRHDPSGEPARPAGVVLYVGSRLPALSETFVYREMLGLRTLGRATLAASLYPPRQFSADPELTALAAETFVIYTSANMLKLPMAVACRPLQMLIAVGDALRADHPSWRSRLKHIVQAGMGLQAARQLRGRRIEHVHAHMANAPAMVALYLARGLGVPFSFTGHAADLFVQRAALGFKLNQASFVACISQWHRSFYQAIVPLDRQVPDARLVIVGDGDDRARLESLAQELHVADRVHFAGARPHAECLAAIRTAGIVALPCRTATNGDKDGIPVVLMEAMAASRAVVAGDLPSIRELIEDGATGRLVPPDSDAALGAALAQLVNDPALRSRMGVAARARVADEFSDQVNWRRLTAALDLARCEVGTRPRARAANAMPAKVAA